MGRRAWRATVYGVAELDMTEHRGERRTLEGVGLRDDALGEENGNPLQYSCLEKSMDRGVWRAEVHGIT